MCNSPKQTLPFSVYRVNWVSNAVVMMHQFFTPSADTRRGGIRIHFGEAATLVHEASALLSLVAEPVITENKHAIPLLPKAGGLQAEERL